MKRNMKFIIFAAIIFATVLANTNTSEHYGFRRVLHESGRHLMHNDIAVTEVFGNSTSLMYYYSELYFGDPSNLSKQALILDTGSGITWFPWKSVCKQCGSHLNHYYDVMNSTSVDILDCNKDNCSWGDENRWPFTQRYGEGSAYYGFWVKEDVFLDEDLLEEDKVQMTVGCVTTETKLFYTQKADGIMGLSTAGNLRSKPIYYHMHDAGLVEHLSFSLWFGHNGGRFTVGGYDPDLIIPTEEEWVEENWVILYQNYRSNTPSLSMATNSR